MPFLEIRLSDIIFDPKVQTYCISPNFKCPSYEHSWSCPPEAPYLEELVSKFNKFYLIYYKLNITEQVKKEKAKNHEMNENEIRNVLLIGNFLRNKLEEEIHIFFENYRTECEQKLILWDGFCRTCFNEIDKGCTYDDGDPCRYPDKKRFSMEAVGIDVTHTVRNLNFNIEWPPTNYVYRFGLVCFKQ
ncbi:MAG: DUF2284 domain-containing protein [Candidatus Thorarchaeota archaeon]